MPYYDYKCPECAHRFEDVKPISERAYSQCPLCNVMAEQVISPVQFDPRMGCDPDFPTAYKKWGDNLRKRSTGEMKDSNNTAYGTDRDVERDAYNTKKRG